VAKVTERGVSCLAAIAPLGVVAWVEELGREPSTLTIKQRFVAIRHVFDWLWLAHIPSASVREPAHVVRRGGTPVIEATEAKAPLDHIDVSSYAGVRDRADGLQLSAEWRGAGDEGGGRVRAEPPALSAL